MGQQCLPYPAPSARGASHRKQAAIEYRGSNRTIYNNAEWLNGWSVLRPLLPAFASLSFRNSPMCASALVERRRTQPLQIRASVSLISPSLPPVLSFPPVSPPPHDSRRPSSSFTLLPLGAQREREREGRTVGDGKSDGSVADNSGASLYPTLRGNGSPRF